jgi:hypothetical protein
MTDWVCKTAKVQNISRNIKQTQDFPTLNCPCPDLEGIYIEFRISIAASTVRGDRKTGVPSFQLAREENC